MAAKGPQSLGAKPFPQQNPAAFPSVGVGYFAKGLGRACLLELLLAAGLRIGEALGLAVCDLDRAHSLIRVEYQLGRDGTRTPLKTEESRRAIDNVLPYQLASETLHESLRKTALAYFKKHKIKWWTSRWDVGRPALDEDEGGLPTGHLNSSQVACVNHLEPARLDRNVARCLARNLDETLVEVQPVEDGGFVAYEWIGEQNYLGEPGPRVRGANITSLDGLMCAQRSDGTRVLLVIEWKYLENYGPESVATSARGTDRVAAYRPLLEQATCPITRGAHERLFFEPYYQLMRQTLLAWQMVEHNEHDATAWLHVHVVPEPNVALRRGGRGAKELLGETMAEKWRSVLKQPERYLLTTATELLAGVGEHGRWSEWRRWLQERYET